MGLFLHKFQHFICNKIGTVLFRAVGVRQNFPFGLGTVSDGGGCQGSVENFLLSVIPEVWRIVGMAGFLVRVAIEPVHAVFVRRSGGTEIPNTPFTEHRCGVTGFFHGFRQGVGFRSDGPVSFEIAPVFVRVHAFQILYVAAARMLARHQHIAGRGTNRSSGIEINPSLSFGGQLVDIWGFDLLLPVAAHFRPAQVIRIDQNHIGRRSLCRMERGNGKNTVKNAFKKSHPI